MQATNRSDRNSGGVAGAPDVILPRARQDRESGQAMVEFALILFPLLILVAGIIQFGIGLNYWLDMNRIANQGARWAAVNAYPGCPRTADNSLNCNGTSISLQQYLYEQPLPDALEPRVWISFPSTSDLTGEPVEVRLCSDYTVVPIIGIGTITLAAEATMRLEQDAKRFEAGEYPPGAASCS